MYDRDFVTTIAHGRTLVGTRSGISLSFLKKEFEQKAKSLVSSKEFSRMAADEMATSIVNGVTSAIEKKVTLEFEVWEPLVVVETHSDGRINQKRDGFTNPILKVDYAEQATAIP